MEEGERLLTGSRGLDRAQVITVETKINTFRFSKWLTSSFSAVGPKSQRYLDPHNVCTFEATCTVSGTGSDSFFQLNARVASPLMLCCVSLAFSLQPPDVLCAQRRTCAPSLPEPAGVCPHLVGGQ